MKESIKNILEDHKDLIIKNSKESWEYFYSNISHPKHVGEITEILLNAGIDPAEVLGYIPKYYLYNSSITSYKIPDNVTGIGFSAFCDCISLTNIIIPNSVKSIGYQVFYGCKGLTNVTIGKGVGAIGIGAFEGCSNLTSIAIPEGVTSIKDSTFYNCSNLKTITIPDSVTSIGDWEFSGCISLTNIEYKGTKELWDLINKSKTWKVGVPSTCILHCTDGDILI